MYTLKNFNDKQTCALYKSILNSLEWFSSEMITLPRAKRVLAPLWENQWNVADNPFWSVVSEVKLTRLLNNNGWTILGFDQKIGTSKKTADIRARRTGIIHHIDVEAASMTKIVNGDDVAFRSFICKRVNDKICKKFEVVPKDEYAVAALIFRPQAANLNRFTYKTSTTEMVKTERKNVLGKVYWFVTSMPDDKNLELTLIDNMTSTIL